MLGSIGVQVKYIVSMGALIGDLGILSVSHNVHCFPCSNLPSINCTLFLVGVVYLRTVGDSNDVSGAIRESRHHRRNCAFLGPYEQLPSKSCRNWLDARRFSVSAEGGKKEKIENPTISSVEVQILFSAEFERDFQHPRDIHWAWRPRSTPVRYYVGTSRTCLLR